MKINNISTNTDMLLRISIFALSAYCSHICLNKCATFGLTWTPIFTAHLTSTFNCRQTARRMIMKLTISTVDTLIIILCDFHKFWIKINWKNKLSKKKCKNLWTWLYIHSLEVNAQLIWNTIRAEINPNDLQSWS